MGDPGENGVSPYGTMICGIADENACFLSNGPRLQVNRRAKPTADKNVASHWSETLHRRNDNRPSKNVRRAVLTHIARPLRHFARPDTQHAACRPFVERGGRCSLCLLMLRSQGVFAGRVETYSILHEWPALEGSVLVLYGVLVAETNGNTCTSMPLCLVIAVASSIIATADLHVQQLGGSQAKRRASDKPIGVILPAPSPLFHSHNLIAVGSASLQKEENDA
jgi:hypothetical protein